MASVPDSKIEALFDEFFSMKPTEEEILEILKKMTLRVTVNDQEFEKLLRNMSIELLIEMPNFSGSWTERIYDWLGDLDHAFADVEWSDKQKIKFLDTKLRENTCFLEFFALQNDTNTFSIRELMSY